MKARNIYYLSIYPLNMIVLLILNQFILRNTPEHELCTMTEDEYVERAMNKCEEIYFRPFMYFLDILATISWIVLIKWLFLP